jgi:RNA polymerase sigma-70 factor (ECF subfamily)
VSPAGDQRLLGVLPDLYRFAAFLGASGPDAEDLVQETMLRAWRERDRLRPDADPRPYVLTICRNVWRDRWRKAQQGPDPLQAPDKVPAPAITGTEPADLADLRDRLPDDVWRALQALPPSYRLVLFLSAVCGHSGREVAEILGWPGGTVRSVYSRARADLRAALGATPPVPR